MSFRKPVSANHLRCAFVTALGLLGYAACADDPVAQNQNTTEVKFGEVEVVLTEPHCDVCTSDDKNYLLERSAILAKVVGLIDGAQTSVDVAQYTFSRRSIRDALIRAHERGVTVRVAMDEGQEREGTRSWDLKEAGVDVRFIEGSQGGLQHAKFMIVDGVTALTGSNNFSSTGVSINEENTLILHGAQDARVVGMACHFEAIWADNPQGAGACSNDQAAFSPSSKGRNLVRDQLRGAKKSIDVIMHHLTLDDLLDELVEAARDRGIEVRLLVNAADAAEHSGGDFQKLLDAGGQIRFKRHNADAYQLLHHKLAIVDGHTLVNGSGNWSGGGFFRNYENFMLFREPHVLARFREMYHRLWTWSLDAASMAEGITAMEQHQRTTRPFFGNLHAHFSAIENGVELDDGKPLRVDAEGVEHPVEIPAGVAESARFTFDYAKAAGLDFLALSPHCREDAEGDTEANMSVSGYEALREVAKNTASAEFLSLAGMEWSSNSTGNHIGVIGSSKLSKVDRGRFDTMYNEFVARQARAGERVFVMLNHPKTFRSHEDTLDGSWDMIYGINLLDIPKAGERNKKFNDFGLDDFGPLIDVRQSWIDGNAMPDPAVVEESWKAMLYAAGDHIRMMEVTLNRGNEFADENPRNPSVVPDNDDPEVMTRRTKVHTDFDYFLTRGFRVAPVASHDNHYANWGTGHTSRTVVIGDGLRDRAFFDAVEFRHVYASEDENLSIQLYAEGRDPMGSVHRTISDSVEATLVLSDPDYAGTFAARIYQGKVGEDGVTLREELTGLGSGAHTLTIDVADVATHFFYVEVFETDANRMAWTAPIWVDHLSPTYSDPAYPHGSGRLLGQDDGGGEGGASGVGGAGAGGSEPVDAGEDPAGRLVINEVDYDQPGADTAEFVELYNAGDVAIDLRDVALVGVNGSNGTEYMRIELSAAGITLGAGQYLVVGTPEALALVGDDALKISLPQESNNVQNGAPDALGILHVGRGELLDALSYEGAVTDGLVLGAGEMSFVEGAEVGDSDTGAGALARIPNGSDTDDASRDWVSVTPTPGRAND